MRRRNVLKTRAIVASPSSLVPRRMLADVSNHVWEGYNFGCRN
jgi:hypothetical protein